MNEYNNFENEMHKYVLFLQQEINNLKKENKRQRNDINAIVRLIAHFTPKEHLPRHFVEHCLALNITMKD